MPANVAKTDKDYLWLLPREFDVIVKEILGLTDTGFSNYEVLWKSVKAFYTN